MEEGRSQDARELGRKELALGWLLMQDWNKLVQLFGANVAIGGLLDISSESRARHEWCRPDREANARLVLEIQAYTIQEDQMESINKYINSPSDPSALNRYLEDPKLLAHYADYVMTAAATSKGTDQENALARQFLQTAARHRDPRVARLARGYLQVRDDDRHYTPSEAENIERVVYDADLHLLERGPPLDAR
jgi:hypothetical protein